MAIVNTFKKKAIDEVLGLGTPKAMILNTTHTTNIDTQEFIDDVSTNEVSGTNYTAGGATLASVTVTIDTGTDTVKLDCNDVTYTNITISNAKYVAYYVDTGTPGTSPIINIATFATTEDRTAQDLVLEIAAGGILDLS